MKNADCYELDLVNENLAFDRAMRSGKLVSTAMLDRLSSAHPEKSSPNYGYGFAVRETSIGRAVGHNGGFDGISADFLMYLVRDTRWPCCRTTGTGRRW